MILITTCQLMLQGEGLTLSGICSDKYLIHLSQVPVVEEIQTFN